MRIVGGRWRGLGLASVGKGDTAAHLRPTSDRVRESVFNVLENGLSENPIPEARVLDLFAGTGALGLEALSRGAAHATFVDNGKAACRLIRENIAKVRAGDITQVLSISAIRLAKGPAEPANLVFLDPPYGANLGQKALAAALRLGWIAESAVVVWEESEAQQPPLGFKMLDHRHYGQTHISVLERVMV